MGCWVPPPLGWARGLDPRRTRKGGQGQAGRQAGAGGAAPASRTALAGPPSRCTGTDGRRSPGRAGQQAAQGGAPRQAGRQAGSQVRVRKGRGQAVGRPGCPRTGRIRLLTRTPWGEPGGPGGRGTGRRGRRPQTYHGKVGPRPSRGKADGVTCASRRVMRVLGTVVWRWEPPRRTPGHRRRGHPHTPGDAYVKRLRELVDLGGG